MNSTLPLHRPANRLNRLLTGLLLCGWLSLALTPVAPAASALYQNDALLTYPGTETSPPMIDATNFVNTGTFIINFTVLSIVQPFYETSDTLNYTNTGVMLANSGFQFDTRSSGSTATRSMAGNFFNSGSISGASTNNLTDPFLGFLGFFGYAQCLVNATNIVNPGTLDVGVDGLIQLTGQNVDLTHGTLNLEGSTVQAAGTGTFGLNTNFWDPSFFLGPNYAESAFFPIAPFYLYLPNSTAFMTQDLLGTNTIVTRAVFIEDTSGSNVTYNVYFGNGVNSGFGGFGSGSVTIEWIGTATNYADGSAFNNYLYLDNNYVRSTATNLFLFNGIPDNFTFTQSPTQLPTGVNPTPAGFFNVFFPGTITNRYAFANAQLVAGTSTTNAIANLAITNLPGRIQISAANELTLTGARITGPNYTSLQAPNQFDGSPALIQSAYSDLNLGKTNGYLTLTNVLSPYTPNWSGNVQAWSTRWLDVVGGVTNDFRVLIVGSQLSPIALAQVQDLILHGSNSIVISDTLNVIRSISLDTKNLTLTTNGIGIGATSLDGELNVSDGHVFNWANGLPNLRNLTNNGAIRLGNLVTFMGSSNTVTVTPGAAAVAATATLSEVTNKPNVAAGNKVIIGNSAYSYVATLTNAVANQVKVAATFDGSLSNLIAAINGAAGSGTVYSSSTVASTQVVAGALSSHAFKVSALAAGVAGNSIYTALSTPTTNVVWSGTYLSGGADATAPVTNSSPPVSVPYDNFINSGLVSDNGSTIWSRNFVSSGTVSNGLGSFSLSSLTTTLTNGLITAGGDVVITADRLVISNVIVQAGRSLSLTATNLLTDFDATNGNNWTVQSTNGPGGNGLILTRKPAQGDLRSTTITNYVAGPNQQTINVWAGEDRGVSVNGYTNNAAVGRLILDALGVNSRFVFSGATTSNALYVDDLQLADAFTNGINSSFDFSVNLTINPNLVIYFAQATIGGTSVAAKIDAASKAGRNGGRLRWVPAYAGQFSSTNLVYPDGSTNTVNTALATSTTIDSDGDGTANAYDPSPFFVSSQVNLNIAITKVPSLGALLHWNSIPGATNSVYYKTNLSSSAWLTLTNFVSPVLTPPAGGWPIANTLFDAVNPAQARYYHVTVNPDASLLYGP